MAGSYGMKYLVARDGAVAWTGPRVQRGRLRDLSGHITHSGTLSGTLALWSADSPTAQGSEVVGSAVQFTQPNGANPGTYEVNWQDIPGLYWWFAYTPAGSPGAGNFDISMSQSDIF